MPGGAGGGFSAGATSERDRFPDMFHAIGSILHRPAKREKLLVASAVGVGGAVMLLRRLLRTSTRNRLVLKSPVPEDIVISQAVELTPVLERVLRQSARCAHAHASNRWQHAHGEYQ